MLEQEHLYKVLIPYTESANPNKRFKVEYSIEAPNRETALKKAEREFNSYTQFSSASWVRILDRENLRAWRILPHAPQTIQDIEKMAGDLANLDLDTLYNVLKALGELEDASYINQIIPLLDHQNQDLSSLAAETLGKIGDNAVLPTLLEKFTSSSHPRFKACILSSISRLATAGDALQEPIIQALGDPDSRVRANAVELVEKLKLSGHAMKLVPMLTDEDNRVRANVLKALWNTHNRVALKKALHEMADDTNRWMRISAAFVLQHTDMEERKEVLRKLISDPDTDVKNASRTTLFRIDDKSCIPLLLDLLFLQPELVEEVRKKLTNYGHEWFSALLDYQPKNREHAKVLKKLLNSLGEIVYREKGFLSWLKFKSTGLFSSFKTLET